MHPLTPARLLHVIANQCAHWRGNPPPPCPWCPAQKRPCKRTYATAFCMSLRTSAHTGVAIRVPWLRRSTLHHCPAARIPTKLVIANQCAHWCGNPFSPQRNLASRLYFGRIRDALRIRPKFCSFYALPQEKRIATSRGSRPAPRNDMQKFATCSHNTGALPVCRRKNVLATHPHGKFLRTPRIKHPCTR